jgi:hypothetical protein
VHRPLLVPDQDVTDRVLIEQGVVDWKNRAARIAEDNLHTLILQGAQQNLRSGLGPLTGHSSLHNS